MRDLLTALGGGAIGFLDVVWGTRPDEGRGRMTTFAATPRLKELTTGLTLADFGRRAGGEPIVLRNTRDPVARHGGGEVATFLETWTETGAELGELVSYRSNATADRLRAEMDQINAALDDANLALDPGGAFAHRIADSLLRRQFFRELQSHCRGQGRQTRGGSMFWRGSLGNGTSAPECRPVGCPSAGRRLRSSKRGGLSGRAKAPSAELELVA